MDALERNYLSAFMFFMVDTIVRVNTTKKQKMEMNVAQVD